MPIIVCRGSMYIGNGCGLCSKCRREIDKVFKELRENEKTKPDPAAPTETKDGTNREAFLTMVRQEVDFCLAKSRWWRDHCLTYEGGAYIEAGDVRRGKCLQIAKRFEDIHELLLQFERSVT